MPPARPPQPTRFAIQKARKKGWTTLEVGEELAQVEARFDAMVNLNPKAYFRLIQLEYNPDSAYEGMEFNWKLIHLHDPSQTGGKRPKAPARGHPAVRTGRRAGIGERVRIPVRVYLAVILIGLLLGALVYLRYGMAP